MPKPTLYQTVHHRSRKLPGWVGAVFYLVLWQILAWLLDFEVLFPGPLAVAERLLHLGTQGYFWKALASSLLQILCGFLVGFLLAVLLGFSSYFLPATATFINPLISVIKSAPLAALTIILMIWLEPAILPFVLILLAIVPPLYASTLAGLEQAAPELLEMAFVYRFRKTAVLRAVYLPSLQASLRPSLEYTSGLAWKAGVTGEILAQPFAHLGTGLYIAKIQLESAEVLAYLTVILFLSWLLNRLVRWLLKDRYRETERDAVSSLESYRSIITAGPAIQARSLTKKFENQTVLDSLDLDINPSQTTVISGPSGRGKTTLFRVLSGLEEADQGSVEYSATPRFSWAFQDLRLLESFTLSENLLFATGLKYKEATGFLAYWEPILVEMGLPLGKQIRHYSGGMKQKASLIRALAVPSNVLILDEVFREVDAQAEASMLQLLTREKGRRTILLATHRPDLAESLGDTVIFLSNIC